MITMTRFKKYLHINVLLIVITLIQACSFGPKGMVDPEKKFKASSKQAVVLISSHVDTGLLEINEIPLKPHLYPTHDVFAFYVSTGKKFTLKNITLDMGEEPPRLLPFNHTKSLKIVEPGIYFYGNIMKAGDKLYLDYLQKKGTLKLARHRYPEVFKKLNPINFDY
jgi:hypothetical protein